MPSKSSHSRISGRHGGVTGTACGLLLVHLTAFFANAAGEPFATVPLKRIVLYTSGVGFLNTMARCRTTPKWS